MLIYIKSLQLRTQLSLNVSLNISIRFVGGNKPSGHVHKILETLAKPKPPISPTLKPSQPSAQKTVIENKKHLETNATTNKMFVTTQTNHNEGFKNLRDQYTIPANNKLRMKHNQEIHERIRDKCLFARDNFNESFPKQELLPVATSIQSHSQSFGDHHQSSIAKPFTSIKPSTPISSNNNNIKHNTCTTLVAYEKPANIISSSNYKNTCTDIVPYIPPKSFTEKLEEIKARSDNISEALKAPLKDDTPTPVLYTSPKSFEETKKQKSHIDKLNSENNTTKLNTIQEETQYKEEHKKKQEKLNEELKKIKEELHNENIKPSEIKMKTFSGKPYVSNITQNTKINDISKEHILEELEKRELIIKHKDGKKDKQFELITIKTDDNSSYILNISKNDAKLTQLGHAYFAEIKKNIIPITFLENLVINLEDIKFMIIVPPKPKDDLFIETGKQKHLIVAFNTKTGEYYGTGYLTSNTSGILVSEQQYKNFEIQQELELSIKTKSKDKECADTSVINDTKQKKQYFVPFTNANKISSNDIQNAKYSKEYLAALSSNALTEITAALKKQLQIQPIVFDTQGLTKDDCLQMCKAFDKIALAKVTQPHKAQHPIPAEQEKKNKMNSEKQKTIKKNMNNNKADEETPI